MLPDIGGSELLVIAAVALIVVGPKDLPILMRKIGQFIGKMRGMANEFRASFDEMARQSELDELRKEVQAMRSGQYAQPFKDAADAARDVGLNETFGEISASLNSGVSGSAPEITVAPPSEDVIEAPKPRPARAKATPKAKVEAVKAVAARTAKTPAKTVAKPAPAKAPAKAKRAPAKKTAELPAPTPRRAPVKKSDILS